MLTATEAKDIAEAYLAPSAEFPLEVAILDAETIERAFGWVFFYESRRHLLTGQFEDRLVGNAPLIVNRFTGKVVPTGTAFPIEYYLSEYEASLSRSGA